jgi:hypothetical protein
MSFFLNSYVVYVVDIPILVPTIIYDIYIDNTVLLLHGEFPVQQSNITDNSSNLFSLTNYGLNKTKVTDLFSQGCIGSSFNGTATTYLTFPTQGIAQFSFDGDFTIEVFIYKSLSTDRGLVISTCGNIANTGGLFFGDDPTTNKLVFFSFVTNSTIATSTSTIPLNRWTHLAVTRSSGTLRLFIDGVVNATVANSHTFAAVGVNAGPGSIGALSNNQQGAFQKGLASNFRVVKGSALYTTNFSVPTSPLTLTTNGGATPSTLPTSSQVSLLILNEVLPSQNNTFLDSSQNNFTITRNGTPTQGSFSPFALNGVAYSPSLHGGSGYFDSGDAKLTLPSTVVGSALDYGTGSFTIECWYMFKQVGPNTTGLIISQTLSYDNNLLLAVNSSRAIGLWLGNINLLMSANSVIPLNTWCHVALVRNGTSVKVYVNGTSVLTATSSASIGGSMVPCINGYGHASGYGNICYISNMRIVKGLAVYTSNFTPPTSPVTRTSNGGATPSTAPTSGQVSLLCDFTNAGIFDSTQKNVLTTVGDAKVSTSVVKFGTGSMYFDGTGDYLTLPRSSNFDFGAGNLTFEGWINVPDISSTYKCIFSQGNPIQIYARAGTIEVFFGNNESSSYFINGMTGPSNSVNANTWTHFAVVRNGTTFTVYVNGIAGTPATGVSQSIFYSATAPNIGYVAGGSGPFIFNGYLDDFRITKGVARYTANFTPSPRAFPDIPYLGVFALSVNTANAGSTTSTQFNLALRSLTNYDFDVDWGDGVVETYTSSNTTGYTHTYPSAGTYTVTIAERSLGGFSGVYYNSTGDRLKILNITQFGGNQFGTDWSNAFYACQNLQISAPDFATAKTQNITTFNNTWYGCTSLTAFPLIDTSKGTNFSATWFNCNKLKDFPAINTSSGTNFNNTWYGCTSLTAFRLIDTSKGTNFENTWYNCNNLPSFPAINTVSATNLKRTWAYNSVLKDFPLIQVPNCKSFPGTWSYCSVLTSFPNIDFSNATNFGNEGGTTATGIFEGCRSISSFNIPFSATRNVTGFDRAFLWCDNLSAVPFLDYSKGTTFYATWMGPNNIKTITGNLTLSAGQNFTQAWRDCRLINSFPETYNFSSATNFSYAWYGCTSLREFNNLYAPKATNFSYAWQNCTSLSTVNLNLSAATDLTQAWLSCTSLKTFQLSAPNVNNFNSTWQNCYSLREFNNTNLYAPKANDFNQAWQNCTSLSTVNLNLSAATIISGAWYGNTNLKNFNLTAVGGGTNFSFAWYGCTTLREFNNTNLYAPKATNFSYAWQNCTSLSTVNLNLSAATNFNGAWLGCTSLKTFQLSAPNVNNFTNTWNNCTSLTAFPLIDTSKGTNFTSTWANCNKLTSFPAINTLSGTSFGGTWYNCTSLTAFPLIDTSSATGNLENTLVNQGTWAGCSSLISFPAINTKNITSFQRAWGGCNKLTSFPAINTLSGTSFGFAWTDCSSLTSFPLIDTGNSWQFRETWRNCISLSASEFPTLNMSKMTNGTNCFNGVKLTTTSYSSLLTSLCATNFNNTVTFHGGNSTFNTPGSAAKVFLTTSIANGGRGWTINDGGYQAGT